MDKLEPQRGVQNQDAKPSDENGSWRDRPKNRKQENRGRQAARLPDTTLVIEQLNLFGTQPGAFISR